MKIRLTDFDVVSSPIIEGVIVESDVKPFSAEGIESGLAGIILGELEGHEGFFANLGMVEESASDSVRLFVRPRYAKDSLNTLSVGHNLVVNSYAVTPISSEGRLIWKVVAGFPPCTANAISD